LGTVSPTKDQLTLVRALHAIRDLRWDAELVGPTEPGYAGAVRTEIERTGLAGRVTLTGPRTGAALERTWAVTDLLLLPSRTEAYGLVVTEALARGVPAVVSLGTGAVEALRAGLPQDGPLPGCTAPPGDAPAWAEVLRTWLADAALRDRWRQAAMSSRDHLPRWEATARTVLAAL
ncbi:glycosyltransferase family 4 protein, partial [Georgenia sp. 10Sc9-8]|nr:glycosyltransferase family 4 protein [Georgenia halotolerans]